MIGGIIGESSSLRTSQWAKKTKIDSLVGRKPLVISAQPECFMPLGLKPIILAPQSSEHREIDLIAECYNAADGIEKATSFFIKSIQSCRGENRQMTANDSYWSNTFALGLENLFKVSGALASFDGEERSMSKIFCDCFDSITAAFQSCSMNKEPRKPHWMTKVPEELTRFINLTLLGAANITAQNHLTHLSNFVSNFRKTAPKDWTDPFLSDSNLPGISLHTSSWGDYELQIILKLCLKGNFSIILPDLHLWSQVEIERIGNFLQDDGHKIDAVWTSLSIPNHVGFNPNWEIFCLTNQERNIDFFKKRVSSSGVNSQGRLKKLMFETPASLDENHGIRHFDNDWTIIPLSKEEIKKLPLYPTQSSEAGSYIKNNMKELFSKRGANHSGKNHNSSRVKNDAIEKENSHSIQKTVKKNDENLKGKESVLFEKHGSEKKLLAKYIKIWERKPSPDSQDTLSCPHVKAYVPIEIEKEGMGFNVKNGAIEVYAPYFDAKITLIVTGLSELPRNTALVAYGTWIEHQKVLDVSSLLCPTRTLKRYRQFDQGSDLINAFASKGEILQDCLDKILDKLPKHKNPSALMDRNARAIEDIHSNFVQEATSLMDDMHKYDYLREHMDTDKVISSDLSSLDNSASTPEDSLCVIETDNLIPTKYREMLKGHDQSEELTTAFDIAFASLLLNTKIKLS